MIKFTVKRTFTIQYLRSTAEIIETASMDDPTTENTTFVNA